MCSLNIIMVAHFLLEKKSNITAAPLVNYSCFKGVFGVIELFIHFFPLGPVKGHS